MKRTPKQQQAPVVDTLVVSADILKTHEEDIETIISAFQALTGAIVRIDTQWVLRCDHPAVMDALRQIVSSIQTGKANKTAIFAESPYLETESVPGTEVADATKKLTRAKRGKYKVRSWEVYDRGRTAILEKITEDQLGARLIDGYFSVGQYLRHPREGWKVIAVSDDGLQYCKSFDASDESFISGALDNFNQGLQRLNSEA